MAWMDKTQAGSLSVYHPPSAPFAIGRTQKSCAMPAHGLLGARVHALICGAMRCAAQKHEGCPTTALPYEGPTIHVSLLYTPVTGPSPPPTHAHGSGLADKRQRETETKPKLVALN
jgi:hypothetical protein